MKRILLAAAAVLLLPIVAFATELSPLLGTMNADNVTLYPGLLTYPSGPFHPMGALYTITAAVPTATGTSAQTLGSFSLPANALDQAGRKVRITAAFNTAANTNSKTCTLNFGSESISTGAMTTSAEKAFMEMIATKTGASTQIVWATGQANVTNLTPVVAASSTETDTAAIAITAICTDGTSSAGDATLVDFFVEYMN